MFKLNTNKSKYLTLFLFCAICVSQVKADGLLINGLYYNLDESTKTAEVTYKANAEDSNKYYVSDSLNIPEVITYHNSPYSVTSIGYNAFKGCTYLTSVTIPNMVINIGFNAFYNCIGLTSVNIPNHVTSIGSSAFYGCIGLNSISIPNTITNIQYGTFSGCTSLSSISIPNSVTSIGNEAFFRTSWFNNQPDGLVYAGLVAYKYKGTMPQNTTIEIKDGTKGIGENAFENCKGLVSINIPNSVKQIGEEAFYNCTSLTSINIPDSVTNIGRSTFYNCTSLTSISIPNSVVSIGHDVFTGTAWYNNQSEKLIYAGLVAYKYREGYPADTSVVIKDGTISLENNVFENCYFLTSVTMPNTLKYIGSSAFRNCQNICTLTIPNTVTSIETNAFDYCGKLKSIHVSWAEPLKKPVVSEGNSSYIGISIDTLYVPLGTKSIYTANSYPFHANNIVEENSPTSIENATINSQWSTVNRYDLQGRHASLPIKGIYIRGGRKTLMK